MEQRQCTECDHKKICANRKIMEKIIKALPGMFINADDNTCTDPWHIKKNYDIEIIAKCKHFRPEAYSYANDE